MRGALANVPGIGQIDIKAGDPDFTVHFDNTKVNANDIVKALIAGGEKDAKVKP